MEETIGCCFDFFHLLLLLLAACFIKQSRRRQLLGLIIININNYNLIKSLTITHCKQHTYYLAGGACLLLLHYLSSSWKKAWDTFLSLRHGYSQYNVHFIRKSSPRSGENSLPVVVVVVVVVVVKVEILLHSAFLHFCLDLHGVVVVFVHWLINSSSSSR